MFKLSFCCEFFHFTLLGLFTSLIKICISSLLLCWFWLNATKCQNESSTELCRLFWMVSIYISRFSAVFLTFCLTSFVGIKFVRERGKSWMLLVVFQCDRLVSCLFYAVHKNINTCLPQMPRQVMHSMCLLASQSNYWMYICWLSVVCHWWCNFSLISTDIKA